MEGIWLLSSAYQDEEIHRLFMSLKLAMRYCDGGDMKVRTGRQD